MIHLSHPARVEGDDRDQPDNAPDRPHGDGKHMPVAPTHGGGVVTGSVHRPRETHFDPAGEPIEFTGSSVRDQTAGGDLSGREPDTRDDNFIDDESDASRTGRQLERDMGTGVDDFCTKAAASKGAGTHTQTDKK